MRIEIKIKGLELLSRKPLSNSYKVLREGEEAEKIFAKKLFKELATLTEYADIEYFKVDGNNYKGDINDN